MLKRCGAILIAGWLWIGLGALAQPASPDTVAQEPLPKDWSMPPSSELTIAFARSAPMSTFRTGGVTFQDTGIRTDEIIRSYRAVGVDLQKAVHEDMARNLSAYPQKHPASALIRMPALTIIAPRI
jgi:hypothetical protein